MIRELRAKHASILEKIRSLQKREDGGAALSESENKEIDTLYTEGKALKEKIEKRERIKELELSSLDSAIPKQERRAFSLAKAVKCLLSNKPEGYEGECHRELEKRQGSLGGGFLIPSEELLPLPKRPPEKRIVDGQTALVSDPLRPDLLQYSLREATIMDKLGARRIMADGSFKYPRGSNASTSGWFSGDGGSSANDAIAESDPTFSSVSVEPHYLGTLTGFSLKQLKEIGNHLSLESILRQNMMDSMIAEIDDSSLNANGTAPKPSGFLNALGATTNNTAKTLSQTSKWGVGDVTKAMQNLMTSMLMNPVSPAWLISPADWKAWQDTQKWSDDGVSMYATAEGIGRVVTSNRLTNKVVLGDWRHFWIVQFMGIELQLGMMSDDFKRGTQRLRAVASFDFVLDRKEAFRQITITRG